MWLLILQWTAKFLSPISTHKSAVLTEAGLQRAARPVPEREAAHLGDALACPRTPPLLPAAAGGTRKKWKAPISIP